MLDHTTATAQLKPDEALALLPLSGQSITLSDLWMKATGSTSIVDLHNALYALKEQGKVAYDKAHGWKLILIPHTVVGLINNYSGELFVAAVIRGTQFDIVDDDPSDGDWTRYAQEFEAKDPDEAAAMAIDQVREDGA